MDGYANSRSDSVHSGSEHTDIRSRQLCGKAAAIRVALAYDFFEGSIPRELLATDCAGPRAHLDCRPRSVD